MNKAGKCISGDTHDYIGDTKLYTYFEAKAACAKLGLRLCTKAETLSRGAVTLKTLTLTLTLTPTLTPTRCRRLL